MSDLNANGAERVTNNKFPQVEIKPLSEAQTKSKAIRGALFHTALISLVMLAAAFFIAENHPDIGLFLMMGFVFLGLYVFFGTIETTLLRNFVGLRASLVGWVTVFAVFAWVSKARALSDINFIFHIDPSLLPMTLVAATVLQVMSLLFWPLVVIPSLIVLIGYWRRSAFAAESGGLTILATLVLSAIAQGFLALLVWGWVESGDQRRSIIYRIAHFSDFNASFRCQELDEKEVSVVFMNPERTQIIFAPKIPDLSFIPSVKATWLQPVTIPDEFPQRACVPL